MNYISASIHKDHLSVTRNGKGLLGSIYVRQHNIMGGETLLVYWIFPELIETVQHSGVSEKSTAVKVSTADLLRT